MKKCLKQCKDLKVACPIKECRYWIDFAAESNCVFDTIDVHGAMTLRETADRLGISYVRVKQIQDGALKKIGLLLKDEAI
jgi:hypothetical protein